ncbi:hypothetical protein FOG18_04425 [Legionella israelensis]|uniref:hypothetical protein n=1 Tax=Legionella israelensis TaxID=454 RepID=UPI00117DCCC3|nr:hypothetical protein [Legionella israelensis]QDP71872.1 hypothetical protein FOG18_04425 [Legionella israelensis]
MSLTMEELRHRVTLTCQSLQQEVEKWLNQQADASSYMDWLQVIKADGLDAMTEMLEQYQIPVMREKVVEELYGTVLYHSNAFQSPPYILSSDSENSVLKKLCLFINMLEKLFLLQGLLNLPLNKHHFQCLELVKVMGDNIRTELSLMDEPNETDIQDYRRRLSIAQKKLKQGMDKNTTAFHSYREEFQYATHVFANTVGELATFFAKCYVLEKDDRYVTSFRYYLPWHALLIRIAASFFGVNQVYGSYPDTLVILPDAQTQLVSDYENNLKAQLEHIERDYQQCLGEAQQSLKQAENSGFFKDFTKNNSRNLALYFLMNKSFANNSPETRYEHEVSDSPYNFQ